MSQVAIHNIQLPVVEYRGQRVVTLAMIDQVHERPEGTARRNFNEHRDKLIEGEDYFVRNSSEARQMGFVAPNGLSLLTEQGYLMLVKSLTDDLAWTVQRQLVSNYFRPTPVPMLPQDLPAALRLAADLAEEKAVLALENQQQAKKIEALENLFMPGETVPQFAKRLNGVNSQQVMAYLIHIKWVFNSERDPDSSPKYRVYAEARDKHWLTEKPTTIRGEGIPSFIKYTPVMLEEGARRLHDIYLAGKLPMKQTWNGEFFYTKFNPENPL
ncbi:ORF6N domain-containing protein [Pseudomonas mosselii]|uniref:ORF6N domain-containing protein n=1 Tax=Pseudomonas mosselii TaxID=78327 RepID=UPI001E3CBA50|nr:ORF6N domain-containing protein [Pseudomonas mosselii]MCL8340113.1 ORF6N domain-containing protein [Pseudomonas mosselii]WJR30619.1 ORF6N domain-containing protein [Pseudomonas mosselii]